MFLYTQERTIWVSSTYSLSRPSFSFIVLLYCKGLSLVLCRKERVVMQTAVGYTRSSNHSVHLQLPHDLAPGVYTITLLTYNNVPLAERLVFVKPTSDIRFEVKRTSGEGSTYAPGEHVTLEIQATANGNIVPATFSTKACFSPTPLFHHSSSFLFFSTLLMFNILGCG